MFIQTKKTNRFIYPPYCNPIGPPTINRDFNRYEIKRDFTIKRLRPIGARQSAIEARIISRAIEIAQNRAPLTMDVLGR